MLTKIKYSLFDRMLKSSKNLLFKEKKLSDDMIYSSILEKIYANFESIEILITSKYCEQARIILRSNMELSLMYIYLLSFPEKKEEYELDCDLLKFKNEFIILKDFCELHEKITNPVAEQFKAKKTELLKALSNHIEYYFNNILKEKNRYKLLTKLKIKQFKLSKEIYQALIKYFNHSFKFPQFEKIYKELKDRKEVISDVNIRDIFYSVYNEYSQIVHGIMSSKTPQNYKDILQISSRINNVILFFSKEKVGVSLDSLLPELNTIKQNIEDVIRDKSL